VRLGRGAAALATLRRLGPRVRDAATRERYLALTADAALQAGQLALVEASERERAGLVTEPAAKRAIALRRIGLLAALKQKPQAEALAQEVAAGAPEPAVADEARLRLAAATRTKDEATAWVKATKPEDAAAARAAGLAALRLLGDAKEAERLLAPLLAQNPKDASLQAALLEVYHELKRPQDVMRVAGAYDQTLKDEEQHAALALFVARSLAHAGAVGEGVKLAERLTTQSPSFEVRQAAREVRLQILQQAGRLKEEIAALEKRGDQAGRAFVALTMERDYELAARLYAALVKKESDSQTFAQGLKQARQGLELLKQRALYEQVLARDPGDRGAVEKLVGVLVALGEQERLKKLVGDMLKGREQQPDALVAVALLLAKAGLVADAGALLERAYGAEKDAAKQQQILLTLGDLQVEGRQPDAARRLFSGLAQRGASPEIRERAMARLAAMLRL
jgi:hypothetical protein